MTKKIIITVLIVFAAAAAVIIFVLPGYTNKEEQIKKEDFIPVKTAPVEIKEMAIPIKCSGMLSTSSEVKLSFLTGGIIGKIYVKEGQYVNKGRLLASLMKDEIIARKSQAEDALNKAKRDFDRVKNLYGDSAATLEQYQNTETALELSRSSLKIADFNLQHSSIYAPARGRVLKKLAEPNELIGPGMPVFIFGAQDKGWIIKTGLSDKDIIRVKNGDSAVVEFDAYPGIKFPAGITEIAEAASPVNSTFEVEITLRRTDRDLKSGFIGKITIYPSDRDKYFIIPVNALAEADADVGYVYTIHSDTARKKRIAVKHIFTDKIAVGSGLENIDKVITEGKAYVRDGSRVKVFE